MTEPILRVEGLRTHFHLEDTVVRAVDGLHYDLHAGKTLAVATIGRAKENLVAETELERTVWT